MREWYAVRELEDRLREAGAPGTKRIWSEPFTPLRLPKLYVLRADPYERVDITSHSYYDRMISRGDIVIAASTMVAQYLESYKDFPPHQRPASFTIDQAMEKPKQGFGK